jgi:phage shock protein PspC (stress-responsive transcriptional regulator)
MIVNMVIVVFLVFMITCIGCIVLRFFIMPPLMPEEEQPLNNSMV